jgi:hypothetical protein
MNYSMGISVENDKGVVKVYGLSESCLELQPGEKLNLTTGLEIKFRGVGDGFCRCGLPLEDWSPEDYSGSACPVHGLAEERNVIS